MSEATATTSCRTPWWSASSKSPGQSTPSSRKTHSATSDLALVLHTTSNVSSGQLYSDSPARFNAPGSTVNATSAFHDSNSGLPNVDFMLGNGPSTIGSSGTLSTVKAKRVTSTSATGTLHVNEGDASGIHRPSGFSFSASGLRPVMRGAGTSTVSVHHSPLGHKGAWCHTNCNTKLSDASLHPHARTTSRSASKSSTEQGCTQDRESPGKRRSLSFHVTKPVESHRASDKYGALGPGVSPATRANATVSPALAFTGPTAARSPASQA